MKRISALVLLILASLASATGAFGQGSRLNANIPFDFVVGNTWMPAGEYAITSPAHLAIQIRRLDGKELATVMTNPSYSKSAEASRLVFKKYGNRYFLRKIDSPTIDAMNVELVPGKAEKRARTLEAGLQSGGETLVAAR